MKEELLKICLGKHLGVKSLPAFFEKKYYFLFFDSKSVQLFPLFCFSKIFFLQGE